MNCVHPDIPTALCFDFTFQKTQSWAGDSPVCSAVAVPLHHRMELETVLHLCAVPFGTTLSPQQPLNKCLMIFIELFLYTLPKS